MATKPVRTVAPTSLPVALDDAKTRLGISGTAEDANLSAFLAAATAQLDGWSGSLGRCLLTQTWEFKLDCWPCGGEIDLPFPDVESVAITYRDANGTTQTVAPSDYELYEDSPGAVVEFLPAVTLPTIDSRPRSITVTLVAGYGDADDVPEPIKTAIVLMASKMRSLNGDSAFLRSETVEGVGSQSWATSDAGKAITAAADCLVENYRVMKL